MGRLAWSVDIGRLAWSVVLEPAAALRGLEMQAGVEGMTQWQSSYLAQDQFQAASEWM